jgi:hypothetical protein
VVTIKLHSCTVDKQAEVTVKNALALTSVTEVLHIVTLDIESVLWDCWHWTVARKLLLMPSSSKI